MGSISTEEEEEEFSFYGGAAVDPVDMSQISTRIKMGGMEITLNAKQGCGSIQLRNATKEIMGKVTSC